MNTLSHLAVGTEQQDRFSRRLADALFRIRYQLIGAILFGVVAPVVLRGQFERLPDQIASYDNSLFGTLCAVLIGYMVFRKVTVLPGSNAFTSITPAFLSSYGIIIAIFFILRLDYSRAQFLVSFVLTTCWFIALSYYVARFREANLGLVSSQKLKELASIPGVSWVNFTSPEAASKQRHLPLVVNLRDPKLGPEWERYLAEEAIAGRVIYNTKQIVESLEGRVRVEHLSENSFGHLAPDSIYAPAKRYIDAITAAVALVLLSPLFLIVAAWIKLDSPGPVIFRQERMGYRGKTFIMFKLRSMTVRAPDAGDKRNLDMTQNDDQRVTRSGRFIRKTRIDELPQLWNIFIGEMSWIGPRPETLSLSSWYEEEIPFYRYRHIVRPGITGWAQVKQGHVTSVDDVRRKLEYDFYYVKHFSVWTDVFIGIQTVRVMFTGLGAK
ncbi:sugar transferase [Thalassovita mediterranea]|nr:sugar transferase [Thalassovita mediterranea]